MAKIHVGNYQQYSTRPKSEHFPSWYGVQAHWHKIPKYLILALAVLWLLGKL